MLVKTAKNPYSDRQIFEIAMNIIRNTNDSDKVKSKWYGKIPGKNTWEDFKTHFEAALTQLKKNPREYHARHGLSSRKPSTRGYDQSYLRRIQYSKEQHN